MHEKSLKRQEKLKNSVLARNRKIYNAKLAKSEREIKTKKNSSIHKRSFQRTKE